MLYIVSGGISWEGQGVLFADTSLNLVVDRVNRMFKNGELENRFYYLLFQVIKDGKPAYYYRVEKNLGKVTYEEVMNGLQEETRDADKGEF